MKILSNLFTRFLNRPLDCPDPPSYVQDTKAYYAQWESQNQNSGFGRERVGTYVGIGQTILGVFLAGYGIIKGSKVAKYVGFGLAIIGALVMTVGKFIGFDFRDPINGAMSGNTRRVQKTPEELGIKNAESIAIPVGDLDKKEAMKGYFIPAKNKTNKTMIHIHGVRNNVGDCLPEIKQLQERMNVNVLIVDPRGFGNSSKIPISFDTLTTDALAMYDYLIKEKKLSSSDISVFGHSLGGQIAIELATQREVNTLISQSTFSTSENIADQYIESVYGGGIVGYFGKKRVTERFKFNAEDALAKIKAKSVILSHGTADKRISHEDNLPPLVAALEKNVTVQNKKVILLNGATHKNHAEHYDKSGFYDVLAGYMGVERFVEEPSIIQDTPVKLHPAGAFA